MDGVSHQLIDRGGDSMRFGDAELERHEGHREDVRWPAEDVIQGGLEGNTPHILMRSKHPASR